MTDDHDAEQLQQQREQLSELVDPVAVFAKLGRELRAAEVLVSLSVTSMETRRAALDGLHSLRNTLDDAQTALDGALDRQLPLTHARLQREGRQQQSVVDGLADGGAL